MLDRREEGGNGFFCTVGLAVSAKLGSPHSRLVGATVWVAVAAREGERDGKRPTAPLPSEAEIFGQAKTQKNRLVR